jgi:zinc protease
MTTKTTKMKLTWLSVLVVPVVFVVSVGAAQPVKSYKDIKFPPMKTLVLPQPERVVLSNGMIVFLLEDHGLPVVEATARLRTGSWWEPPTHIGLASLMAEVMRTGGTARRTGDQLDDLLEGLSASLETSMELTSMQASMFALKTDAPRVFGLMAEMLAQPAFDQKKIDLQKLQLHDGINRRNDNLGGILSREVRRVLYGKESPLARVVEHDHVDRISREDLMDFYRRTVSPDRMWLGVWGDFHSGEMKKLLEQTFGTWKPVKGLTALTLPSLERALPAPRVWFIERPEAAQTHVRLMHLGGALSDPEAPALAVATEIFGSGMASRLFTRVRSEKGLAYSVWGAWSPSYRIPGVFSLGGETKAETTGQFIEAIRQELKTFMMEGSTAEEVRVQAVCAT